MEYIHPLGHVNPDDKYVFVAGSTTTFATVWALLLYIIFKSLTEVAANNWANVLS